MPSLGADMESGRVVAWHVGPGDHVTRGDVVAEVDTDKAVIDVETFQTGTVERILVPLGERVPVGTPLALIAEDAGSPVAPAPQVVAPVAVPPERPPRAAPAPVSPTAGVSAPVTPPPTATGGAAGVRASPLARRHAASLGVDLALVPGSGPGGAVTTADVEHFAASGPGRPAPSRQGRPAPSGQGSPGAPPTGAPPAGTQEAVAPLAGADRQAALRRAVATSMARSKREIPHYYLSTEIDMSTAVRWLTEHNATRPVTSRVLPAAVLLKATALALREAPDLNGFWQDGAFVPADHVHLGVAVALRGGGLVAPAIHDADRLSLAELMAALQDLVRRARSGGLRSSEMADPTVTVTNLGDQGVDVVLPVIHPPQVAIVGFGRVRERPWAADGMVGARPTVTAGLAADHRVTDGHRGALLLSALDRLLQRPEEL